MLDKFFIGDKVSIIVSDDPDTVYTGIVERDASGRRCISFGGNDAYYPTGADKVFKTDLNSNLHK